MKNKKKLIIGIVAVVAVIAIAVLAYFLIFKGGNKSPSLRETVDNRVIAYETDLRDSLSSMTDQESVANYLATWAKNKGIEAKTDKNNNVVLTINATEGFESKAPVVILCGYDYSCMETYINSIVSALTIAKNNEEHGAYKIIFFSQENGNFDSVEALSAQHFTDDTEVIYLGNSSSSRISKVTGGYESYNLSQKIKQVTPTHNKAYKITISGLPSLSIGSKSAYAPNPIKTLGNLLANFKSTSLFFELASFSGGSNGHTNPSEASMIIVIDEDTTAKLEKKLDSAIEKFCDKNEENYPNLQYTYEEVEMPSKVLSPADTDALVSLMYTSLNGVHYKDNNGDVVALANIGFANTENSSFNMNVTVASSDQFFLDEMREAYQTTCGLSGVEYSLSKQYDIFAIDESNQAFEDAFRAAYTKYRNTGLDNINMPEASPLSAIYAKNPNVKLLIAGITEKTKDNFAGGIITYLKNPATN